MDQRPAVSVIVPFLNAERYLGEAIESVLSQTCTSWELLLIDDGSTDGSTAIARSYADRHPGKIHHLEHDGHVNLGSSASRNHGIERAAGRYISFLDADDIYLPERLDRHVAVLDQFRDVDVVQSKEIYWYSWCESSQRDYWDESLINSGPVVEPPALLASVLALSSRFVPGTCSITVRREAIDGDRWFEDEFRDLYDDQVLITKLYAKKKVYVLDKVLAWYRQHDASMTHRAVLRGDYHPDRPHASRIAFLQWLEKYLDAEGVTDRDLIQALKRDLWSHRHPLAARLRRSVAARWSRALSRSGRGIRSVWRHVASA